MTTKIETKDIHTSPSLPLISVTKFEIAREREIDEAARRIITSPGSDEDKQKSLSKLLRERATLIRHIPINGIKGTAIYFNIRQSGLAPTPLCPAYNKMRLPTISSYHTIGSNIASVLLDPSAIRFLPKEVLEKMGDLSGKKVELFWTAIDGRPFVKLDRPINLVTHPWAHPHSLPGDDVKRDVQMGIFPHIGFQNRSHPGAVAFDHISPMEVYTHGDPKNMLYSPDNAHLDIIPDSPFGVLWTVAQKDNQIAITKMLVILNYDHPICEHLIRSIRDCDTLDTHLSRMTSVKEGIQKTFKEMIDLFEKEDPTAMSEFRKLPLTFQQGIFKETWILLGSPKGIHGDFGKASFENNPSLKTEFHCSSKQRAAAIRQFADQLQHLLLDSQMDLMINSQTLVKSDNALKMMQCAQLIQNGHEKEAMELFDKFSKEEKEDVFFAIWELSKCPRGNFKFGLETFIHPETKIALKVESLLLAASRLPPPAPLAIKTTTDAVPFKKEVVKPSTPSLSPLTATKSTPDGWVSRLVQGCLPKWEVSPAPRGKMSPDQVLTALMELLFNADFALLSISVRKSQIMELFDHLPIATKNAIYGKIYENSVDPLKGGDSWAELHVADDLNALVLALQDVLPT